MWFWSCSERASLLPQKFALIEERNWLLTAVLLVSFVLVTFRYWHCIILYTVKLQCSILYGIRIWSTFGFIYSTSSKVCPHRRKKLTVDCSSVSFFSARDIQILTLHNTLHGKATVQHIIWNTDLIDFCVYLLCLCWICSGLANVRKVLHNELHYFNADVLGFGRFCVSLLFDTFVLLIADLEVMWQQSVVVICNALSSALVSCSFCSLFLVRPWTVMVLLTSVLVYNLDTDDMWDYFVCSWLAI